MSPNSCVNPFLRLEAPAQDPSAALSPNGMVPQASHQAQGTSYLLASVPSFHRFCRRLKFPRSPDVLMRTTTNGVLFTIFLIFRFCPEGICRRGSRISLPRSRVASSTMQCQIPGHSSADSSVVPLCVWCASSPSSPRSPLPDCIITSK